MKQSSSQASAPNALQVAQWHWQAVIPDVLLIIARHAATYNSHWDTNIILKLSHVCRHWRHALVSSPSLWNKIDFPSNTIAISDLLLSRIANYPLKISIILNVLSPSFADESRHCRTLISSHIHRIRTVTIRVESFKHGSDSGSLFSRIQFPSNPQQLLDPILSLFKESAPMLVSLSISGFYEVQFPELFLEDVAPNLKQLEISCMSISYKMPIFKRVTHLCLSHIQGFTSVHQLLCVLKNTSEFLKVLKIGPLRGIRSPPGSLSQSDSDIRDLNGCHIHMQLPHLEALSLDLDAEVLMVVLNRITMPSDVDWTINCSDALCQTNLNITPLLSLLNYCVPFGSAKG